MPLQQACLLAGSNAGPRNKNKNFTLYNYMKRIFKFLLKTTIWFVVLSVIWVLAYKYCPVPYTPLMAIRYFEAEESVETKHEWRTIDEISEEIQLAVICSEDLNFLNHKGISIKSIFLNKTVAVCISAPSKVCSME